MRVSDFEPGQFFKLATDPRVMRRLASEADFYAVAGNDLVALHPDSYAEPAEKPGESAMRFDLETVSGEVRLQADGLAILFDGYGRVSGHAPVVIIEPGERSPVLRAWNESASVDPSHRIDFRGARV